MSDLQVKRRVRTSAIVATPLILALVIVSSAMSAPAANRPGRAATVDADCGCAAELKWHSDYWTAYRQARRDRRMLLVNFVPSDRDATQRSLERWIEGDGALRRQLQRMVLLRLPSDYEIELASQPTRLIDHNAFRHLRGNSGIAIIDLEHTDKPYHGHVVTALPFASGKYYRWRNSHLNTAVGLPPGTITQRTMVWAVRIHPEGPASTEGHSHPALLEAAAEQSSYQARVGVQGHHHWGSRFHQVSAAAGAHSASEVVAESWPGQDLIDSCIDCVASWRHSPGHWGKVRGRHRLFGFDIRRGRNGIWYGTGIFAN